MAVSFAEALIRRCPPWLQRVAGRRLMGGLGDTIDVLRDKTAEAIDARLPRASRPDALAYVGRDRAIVRGLEEPDESYAARLKRWITDHRKRGNAHALLRQLEAYYASAPKQIDVVYETGTRYRLALDGTITKDAIEWREGSDPARWAIAFVFVWFESEPTITYPEAQSVIAIVRDWMPAHIAEIPIWGIFPDGDVWGYPEGAYWGDDDSETWGAPYAIDFYGVEEPLYLTFGGDFVTFGGDYVVIYP